MTTRRQDTPFPNLCHFEFSDGRACSMPAAVGNYCRSHADVYKRPAATEDDLSSELAQFYRESDGSLDVHRALERVFKAVSANRITNRRAATLGYLGQLILLSKPGFNSPAGLTKSELHDMADVTCHLLRTAYPESAPRRSGRSRSKPSADTSPPSGSAAPQSKRQAS